MVIACALMKSQILSSGPFGHPSTCERTRWQYALSVPDKVASVSRLLICWKCGCCENWCLSTANVEQRFRSVWLTYEVTCSRGSTEQGYWSASGQDRLCPLYCWARPGTWSCGETIASWCKFLRCFIPLECPFVGLERLLSSTLLTRRALAACLHVLVAGFITQRSKRSSPGQLLIDT